MNNLIELNDKARECLENNNLDINKPDEILEFIVSDIQNNILKNGLTDAINAGIDVGIRAIFPNSIEDQIVKLNDNIYNYGLKEGLSRSLDDAIDFGKSAIGVLTNNFENAKQAQMAISKGGTIDKISSLLDTGIDKLKSSKTIDSTIAKTLKSGKDTILKNIEESIDNSFSTQIKNTEKFEKYISNWKENFEAKDFSKMEKEYNNMKKIVDSIMPTEEILSEYNTIENLHNLIKNNGKNFDLSKDEIELANKLIN